MIVISERIRVDVLINIPKSQAAYQKGRDTIEQSLSLKQLIEKSIEFNKPLHFVFIDYLKAWGHARGSTLHFKRGNGEFG